jgi:hypothetical protein
VLLLLTSLALASPDLPDETPGIVPIVDVSGHRDRFVLLDDGAGHLVAVLPDGPSELTFYGDARHLWQLQVYASSSEQGVSLDLTARDFRARDRNAGVHLRDGVWSMSCADVTRALTPMSADKAREVLATVSFHERRWRRNAVALYRDDFGVYTFIDRATGDDEDADHHVYMGWRGQVLRTPLKLVASDSLGRVYAAGNGTRRLVLTRDEARYVEGATERVLHALDLVQDGPMLYGPLGVYGDAPHGTPCDALLTPPRTRSRAP